MCGGLFLWVVSLFFVGGGLFLSLGGVFVLCVWRFVFVGILFLLLVKVSLSPCLSSYMLHGLLMIMSGLGYSFCLCIRASICSRVSLSRCMARCMRVSRGASTLIILSTMWSSPLSASRAVSIAMMGAVCCSAQRRKSSMTTGWMMALTRFALCSEAKRYLDSCSLRRWPWGS